MVSKKTVYRLLSAIDEFRSAVGDGEYADEVKQLGQLESDLKKEVAGDTPDDDKKKGTAGDSFDEAAQKSKEQYAKSNKDDAEK